MTTSTSITVEQEWTPHIAVVLGAAPPIGIEPPHLNRKCLKIETILFVPIILTFSKNLRCLNFPVWEQCCQQKNSKNDQKFFESAKMKKIHNFFSHQKCLVTLFCACVSAKFKHLKFFENVKIIGTNNIDSILVSFFSLQTLASDKDTKKQMDRQIPPLK